MSLKPSYQNLAPQIELESFVAKCCVHKDARRVTIAAFAAKVGLQSASTNALPSLQSNEKLTNGKAISLYEAILVSASKDYEAATKKAEASKKALERKIEKATATPPGDLLRMAVSQYVDAKLKAAGVTPTEIGIKPGAIDYLASFSNANSFLGPNAEEVVVTEKPFREAPSAGTHGTQKGTPKHRAPKGGGKNGKHGNDTTKGKSKGAGLSNKGKGKGKGNEQTKGGKGGEFGAKSKGGGKGKGKR